jgi:hypothetical protein
LEPTPTGHAAATAHLQGKIFPRNAGFEDEEDAGECLAILQRFSTGIAEATRLGWWQQRLEDLPQFIRDERLRLAGRAVAQCLGLFYRRNSLEEPEDYQDMIRLAVRLAKGLCI